MNASTPAPNLAPDEASIAALSSLEAEFEYALRTLNAMFDRRLLIAAAERQELETELTVLRASVAGREHEASKLRKQVKELSRSLADSERDIKRFEQGLQAVEDGFDEQLGIVEDALECRLASLQAEAEITATRACQAEQQARNCQEQVAICEQEVLALQGEVFLLREERDRMLASISWRVTSPLRTLSTLFTSKGSKDPVSSS